MKKSAAAAATAPYAPRKQTCKVCKNAGKSEKEYTNHNTKTIIGNKLVLTCPTILEAECAYCHNKGHFKAECPVLKSKKITVYNSTPTNTKHEDSKKEKNTFVHRNLFAEIDDEDSEDEQDAEDAEDKSFPRLSSTQLESQIIPANKTYATIVSHVQTTSKATYMTDSFTQIKMGTPTISTAPKTKQHKNIDIHISWADPCWDESDDDDDDDYNEYDRYTDYRDAFAIKTSEEYKKQTVITDAW